MAIADGIRLRLVGEDMRISFYRLDTGEKLLIPAELATALSASTTELETERQRRTELEAELACYRKQFGDLTAESITLR